MTHMKRTAHVVRSQTMRLVKSYLNGTSILDLARRCNYPPSMMARLIVENVARTSSSPSPSPSTPADSSPAATSATAAAGTASGNLDGGDADEAAKETAAAAAAAAARTTDSTNGNNRGGASDKVGKRFLTTALRYPEKTLGDARASVSPEYLFSERNGAAAANAASSRDGDRGGDDADDHRDLPRERRLPVPTTAMPPATPLSRLSKEVREAVDSDPMYGESPGYVGFSGMYLTSFFPHSGVVSIRVAGEFLNYSENERRLECISPRTRTPTGQGEAQHWHRVRIFARGDAPING